MAQTTVEVPAERIIEESIEVVKGLRRKWEEHQAAHGTDALAIAFTCDLSRLILALEAQRDGGDERAC